MCQPSSHSKLIEPICDFLPAPNFYLAEVCTWRCIVSQEQGSGQIGKREEGEKMSIFSKALSRSCRSTHASWRPPPRTPRGCEGCMSGRFACTTGLLPRNHVFFFSPPLSSHSRADFPALTGLSPARSSDQAAMLSQLASNYRARELREKKKREKKIAHESLPRRLDVAQKV